MLNYFDDKQNSKKTVLIVDPDQKLCVKLAKQTRALGLKPLAANDFVSAEKIMERQFPELLIIDGDLPAKHGMTFLESLGVDAERCEIPVVVLCNNPDMRSIPRIPTLIAYYVHKSAIAWDKIETFIHELIDVNATSANKRPNKDNQFNLNDGANQ